MKYLILLGLFACTSHKAPKATKTEVSAAAESEAKPVSPLTVEPCFCMKIYQPVCVDGVQYGNSCEAECHGNKKWTEGNCPTPKKK